MDVSRKCISSHPFIFVITIFHFFQLTAYFATIAIIPGDDQYIEITHEVSRYSKFDPLVVLYVVAASITTIKNDHFTLITKNFDYISGDQT